MQPARRPTDAASCDRRAAAYFDVAQLSMNRSQITAALKTEAKRLGFTLSGACPAVEPNGIERFHAWLAAGYAGEMHYLADRAEAYHQPRSVLDGARSVLMLAMDYQTVSPATVAAGQGRISRYAWGNDYHDVIRRRLNELADFLRGLAPQALCAASSTQRHSWSANSRSWPD